MVSPPRERSFWSDTIAAPHAVHDQPLPEHLDVAIVGGGFTGLSAALALAEQKATVAVFERHNAGWGASSRNGGMVLTGLKVPVESLIAKYGVEAARNVYGSSLAAIDFVESIVDRHKIDCDFARRGHLEVASKPGHFSAMRQTAQLLERDFGRTLKILDRQALQDEIGSNSYHGALFDDRSAGLNPARFAAGLARAAQDAGATLFEQCAVEVIECPRGASRDFTVTTSRGGVRARAVLLATGAYTDRVAPGLRSRVISIGSYIIATSRLDANLAAGIIRNGRMVFDSNHFLHYFRLTPDRRMLFGGRAAFFPESERTIGESARILRHDMVAAFPQLRDTAIEYAWGGSIDFTFDMLPHAGTLDGIHYALGYAGHGVGMATYLGARIAAAIAGEPSRNSLVEAPIPAAPPGLSGANPWFLPAAGAWYKMLDWLT